MPSRAFVPVPLVDADPRVYKSFRGRQLKGLLLAVTGAAVMLIISGVQDFTGYALAFLAALPGFAYGYYQPQGKPVEYWVRVLIGYYAAPQILSGAPGYRGSRWHLVIAQLTSVFRIPSWRRRRPPHHGKVEWYIGAGQVQPKQRRRWRTKDSPVDRRGISNG